jgi:hypothetical protein
VCESCSRKSSIRIPPAPLPEATKIRLTATDLEKFHHKQQSIESLDTITGVADALRR